MGPVKALLLTFYTSNFTTYTYSWPHEPPVLGTMALSWHTMNGTIIHCLKPQTRWPVSAQWGKENPLLTPGRGVAMVGSNTSVKGDQYHLHTSAFGGNSWVLALADQCCQMWLHHWIVSTNHPQRSWEGISWKGMKCLHKTEQHIHTYRYMTDWKQITINSIHNPPPFSSLVFLVGLSV